MLGGIVMLFVGFKSKRIKWWHIILLLMLAAMAVNMLEVRITKQGFLTGWEWRFRVMFQQTLIDAALYLFGIWVGIAWATKKAMKRQITEDEQSSDN